MDEQTQVLKIIEFLELVQKKPGMYIGPLQGIDAFLSGFGAACGLFGLERGYDDLSQTVLVEHGWGQTTSPMLEMQRAGLDEHAAVRELLAIEIEVWKRRYKL
jgi:hypothetical protein